MNEHSKVPKAVALARAFVDDPRWSGTLRMDARQPQRARSRINGRAPSCDPGPESE
jgi:hypothetical protein